MGSVTPEILPEKFDNAVPYEEYRHSLLVERVRAEHAEFIAAERLKPPDEIMEDAWRIVCYDDILMALENDDSMNGEDIDALLTLRCPIANIYEEHLQKDTTGYMDDIMVSAIDTAQKQRETLAKDPSPDKAMDEWYVSEYLDRYVHDGNNHPHRADTAGFAETNTETDVYEED